jgi:hypothetical protein
MFGVEVDMDCIAMALELNWMVLRELRCRMVMCLQ